MVHLLHVLFYVTVQETCVWQDHAHARLLAFKDIRPDLAQLFFYQQTYASGTVLAGVFKTGGQEPDIRDTYVTFNSKTTRPFDVQGTIISPVMAEAGRFSFQAADGKAAEKLRLTMQIIGKWRLCTSSRSQAGPQQNLHMCWEFELITLLSPISKSDCLAVTSPSLPHVGWISSEEGCLMAPSLARLAQSSTLQ